MRSDRKLFGILLAADIETDPELVRMVHKHILKRLRSPDSYAHSPVIMISADDYLRPGPIVPEVLQKGRGAP
jgi:hypothetical protein